MYTIEIEKECACFVKSRFSNNMTFESREDMINRARVMECLMNQEFCMKHFFEAVDYGDKIVIHSILRPEDDEDLHEDLNIKKLLAKNPVTIGFNAGEATPNGVCSGEEQCD